MTAVGFSFRTLPDECQQPGGGFEGLLKGHLELGKKKPKAFFGKIAELNQRINNVVTVHPFVLPFFTESMDIGSFHSRHEMRSSRRVHWLVVSLIRCFVVALTRCSLIFPFLFPPLYSRHPLPLSQSTTPLRLVNPFIGTDGHGHTFPGATTPFGMVQLSPDTRTEGWDACGGYHYSDSTILGFSHTHLSGTGIADYGDILFLPSAQTPGLRTSQRFSHKNEDASPGYYRVVLDDRIIAELTASPRVGVHRYTFPASAESNIVIDLKHGLGPDNVVDSWLEFLSDREVAGFRRSTGWAKDQHVYFVAQFSKPFTRSGKVGSFGNAKRLEGTEVRGFVQFTTTAGEAIVIKVGISSVDIEGARKNLAEVPHWNFEQVRKNAEDLWTTELQKIQIEGGTLAQLQTFYTALYHTMIAPNLASDIGGKYRGMDATIRQAGGFDMYTVFSLWDTFRALHPLLTLLDTTRTRDFLLSLLSKYRESAILPVWELASNETWTMIGYHSVPVITDAYVKGIRGFDAEEAFAAMKRSAALDHFGLKEYRQYGLIPGDAEAESVSKTLEYAYDDWCIATMAGQLGKKDDLRIFLERAQYFRNLYDPATGFMRPRVNGHWLEPFDPTSVSFHYTEANAWQYSFFAPHDPAGLIGLMGGRERFEQRLDSLFFGSSQLSGRRQADITGLIGQYAHGNEPSHHFAYLYNYTASPWKTQLLIRKILDSLYSDRPDGLCGNDDCGQMSAWCVFSSLGFYPVMPGTTEYHLSSPVFPRATINLENGNSFTIKTSGSGTFIQDVRRDSAPHSSVVLSHAYIRSGSTLEIKLGPERNSNWNRSAFITNPRPLEPSITTAPYFVSPGRFFKDSLRFEVRTATSGAEVFVRLEGEIDFVRYSGPLTITSATFVEAFAANEGHLPSKVVRTEFMKFQSIGTLRLESPYSQQYTGGGDQALVDGLRGGPDFRLGAWQGYEGNDLIAILDLRSVKAIEKVELACLQDENSWIFFPEYVEFSFSRDGSVFSEPVVVPNDIPTSAPGALLKEFTAAGPAARFLRIKAKNIGVCPSWHKGAGGKAWLFVDEIVVKTRE
jgi:predicted alpha-1,2-mannosidase